MLERSILASGRSTFPAVGSAGLENFNLCMALSVQKSVKYAKLVLFRLGSDSVHARCVVLGSTKTVNVPPLECYARCAWQAHTRQGLQ